MTERIVIGKAEETRVRLEHGGGEVYLDRTNPLGSLLFSFEADREKEWNINLSRLRESYGKVFPFEGKRWKLAQQSAAFLQEKYQSAEPAAIFAAIRTWEEYLGCYHLKHGPQRFMENMSQLYRPFFLYDEYKPWQEEAAAVLSKSLKDGDSQVELWYPVKKRPFECVVAFSSFLPVIFYYLHKVEEWGYIFQGCKVCGKSFLAKSKHYKLCSDECRKVQAVEAKRLFDENAKGERIEQLHESAYYYWYNRLRKLKRTKTADPERLAAVEEAFKAFRAEAVQMKNEVKRGDRSLTDFTAFLAETQDEVDSLME
ncbi:MAG: hypothetical protein LBV27_09845 [Oscillospiraceae bacterium]|nr:hypothetical protein [Oscillospiraceae bacterium]